MILSSYLFMFNNNKATLIGTSIMLGLSLSLSPLTPSAQAATFTYTGTTIDDPIWNRPVASFSNLEGLAGGDGETVNYDTFSFTVSVPGSYVFQSTASFDNYTFLYQNAFNPNNQTSNFVIGNDDISGLPPFNSGFTTALNIDTNYFLVTTAFFNFDTGNFSNTIAGAGNILPITATSVPEPATILGSLAAFSYGVYSRRKMKRNRSASREIF